MSTSNNMTLEEWAIREGISRRKAEMLSHLPGFPQIKEPRTITRTVWQKVVPPEFTLADLSS
jgi:hypothetical protein